MITSASEYSRRDKSSVVPNDITPATRPRTCSGTPTYAYGPQRFAELVDLRRQRRRQPRHRFAQQPVGRDHRLARLHDAIGKGWNAGAGVGVEQSRAELFQQRLLGAVDMTPGELLQLAALVSRQHVAIVAKPRQGEVDGAMQRVLVIERGREQRADLGEKRETVARGDRFVIGEPLPLDELGALALDPASIGDIARDLRDADNRAGAVADRRNGDETSTSDPSLRRRTVSNGSILSPAVILRSTSCSSASRSAGIISVIGRPMASAAE